MSKSDINITIVASKLRVTEEAFMRIADGVKRFGMVANRVWRDLHPEMTDEDDARGGGVDCFE